jgi:hypothetical protein
MTHQPPHLSGRRGGEAGPTPPPRRPRRSTPAVHLLATYHLPSWQGGDVPVARCERGRFGWSGGITHARMSVRLEDVTCGRCLRLVAEGWGDNLQCGPARGRKIARGEDAQ